LEAERVELVADEHSARILAGRTREPDPNVRCQALDHIGSHVHYQSSPRNLLPSRTAAIVSCAFPGRRLERKARLIDDDRLASAPHSKQRIGGSVFCEVADETTMQLAHYRVIACRDVLASQRISFEIIELRLTVRADGCVAPVVGH
jgi:hypothetical protein